ncbi:MAG TPA: ABC transporter [Firmicutes bacterium]|nr:ABC transporter [Bacillota bacterium]
MKTFLYLTKRNIKVFFTDKGMFFASMITPIILLVLYGTFLAGIYERTFTSYIPAGVNLGDDIIKPAVSGQIVSSILAVCCITVAFCSNVLMSEDKVKKVVNDFMVSPVKRSTLQLSYFFATWISTLIVNLIALAAGLIYVVITGWLLTAGDVFLLISDIFLLSAFGSAMSSAINFFLRTEGQISCVGTIVSAGYGFVCGAYMPLNTFSSGLRNFFMFLPGTYGTCLLRRHALSGVVRALQEKGISGESLDMFKESMDFSLKFFSHDVPVWAMYLTMLLGILLFLAIYIGCAVLKYRNFSLNLNKKKVNN